MVSHKVIERNAEIIYCFVVQQHQHDHTSERAHITWTFLTSSDACQNIQYKKELEFLG